MLVTFEMRVFEFHGPEAKAVTLQRAVEMEEFPETGKYVQDGQWSCFVETVKVKQPVIVASNQPDEQEQELLATGPSVYVKTGEGIQSSMSDLVTAYVSEGWTMK